MPYKLESRAVLDSWAVVDSSKRGHRKCKYNILTGVNNVKLSTQRWLSSILYRERWTMSVDEDLVATRVPEATSLLLAAEQRVGEPGEGPQLCLSQGKTTVLSCVS